MSTIDKAVDDAQRLLLEALAKDPPRTPGSVVFHIGNATNVAQHIRIDTQTNITGKDDQRGDRGNGDSRDG